MEAREASECGSKAQPVTSFLEVAPALLSIGSGWGQKTIPKLKVIYRALAVVSGPVPPALR